MRNMETRVTKLEADVTYLKEEDANNCEWHRTLENQISDIELNMNKRFISLENNVNKKLDKLDALTSLTVQLDHLREDYKDLKTDIRKVTDLPKNNYNALKMSLAAAIISGIAGYVISLMTNGGGM